MKMAQDDSKQYPGRKCFYCNRESTNITIDEEGVMFYLCQKHLMLFRAHNPKGGRRKKQDDE